MAFPWTPQVINRMASLADSGLSAAAIAATLSSEYHAGLTRNAVIGKLQRTGIELKNKCIKVSKAPADATRRKVRLRPPRLTVAVSPAPQPAVEASLKAVPVTFAELQSHHCKWPIGDVGDPDFRFCGARRSPGRPYCTAHHAKAWRRP